MAQILTWGLAVGYPAEHRGIWNTLIRVASDSSGSRSAPWVSETECSHLPGTGCIAFQGGIAVAPRMKPRWGKMRCNGGHSQGALRDPGLLDYTPFGG